MKDGNSYTDVEKDTVKYIRENYKWTDEADTWFRNEINKWNLQGHNKVTLIHGMAYFCESSQHRLASFPRTM